jgi:hypothetical protein
MIDDAVRELLDRAQIHDLLARYARGVDRRDLDLVRSCFTDDAAYEGALSKSDIAQALATLREGLARYTTTMHFIANQVVELDGDTAHSETYAVAYHRAEGAGGGEDLVLGVRYRDELVRDAGRWRICHRRAVCDWQRRDPVVVRP